MAVNQNVINQAKKEYDTAKAKGDRAGMEAAHAKAESERAKAGYSGGADGSQRINISSGSSSKGGGGGSSSGISATYGTQSANGMDQFYANNMDRINGIANANGVDINTAKSMLISNINGTGNYAGGGIANMGALSNAYKNALAYDSRNNNANMGNLGTAQMPSQYQNLLDQQLKAQQEAIARQTQATVDSINSYRPQIEQSYEDQQRANYIAAEKNKAMMNDYLKAMGYSGGMAESTLADINTNYQNNRLSADTEKNNALRQLENQVAQARVSGDTSLADAMGDYYKNYLNMLQNQEQINYNRQLQDQENYANSIGAYYQDYQSEINRLLNMGVPEDDYRIKLLKQARNEKMQAEAQAEAKAEQQAFTNELNWNKYLVSLQNANTAQARANKSGSKSSSTTNAVTGLNW